MQKASFDVINSIKHYNNFRWAAFLLGTPLFKPAMRALSVVCHSASVERANSRMGFYHSKARNRLAIEKVRKLMLIASSRPTSRGRGVLAAAAVDEATDESASDSGDDTAE